MLRHFLGNALGRLAADAAINPVLRERHGTLDAEEVLALVLRDGVLQRLLGLVARGRHQSLRVIQRDLVEEDVGDDRVRAAQEGLAAAGALLKMKPDHRDALLRFEGLDHLVDAGALHADARADPGAEAEKFPARDAAGDDLVVDRLFLGEGFEFEGHGREVAGAAKTASTRGRVTTRGLGLSPQYRMGLGPVVRHLANTGRLLRNRRHTLDAKVCAVHLLALCTRSVSCSRRWTPSGSRP